MSQSGASCEGARGRTLSLEKIQTHDFRLKRRISGADWALIIGINARLSTVRKENPRICYFDDPGVLH